MSTKIPGNPPSRIPGKCVSLTGTEAMLAPSLPPHQTIDCAIIGAGPAGLSAALWLRDLEIPFLLIEQGSAIGGDVENIRRPINNYLGLRAIDGHAFLTQLRTQIHADSLPVIYGRRVARIDAARRIVHFGGESDQDRIEARTLILAMGLRRRELPLPGLGRFLDAGVTLSATAELDQLRGHEVAVVGGGDGALENALLLAEQCPRVHLIVRSPVTHGRTGFFECVRGHDRIVMHLSSEIVEAAGDNHGLSSLRVRGPSGDAWLAVRHLVIKIGFAPNVEAIVPGTLALDRNGYVVADPYMRTSAEGVYVAGDLRNPRSPSLAAAVGDGAVAAREVAFFLGRIKAAE
jgi:thioredoxin reductase (NADPH)